MIKEGTVIISTKYPINSGTRLLLTFKLLATVQEGQGELCQSETRLEGQRRAAWKLLAGPASHIWMCQAFWVSPMLNQNMIMAVICVLFHH